ncbi:hypothetical protein DFP72DRAFT_804645 [Ephemerocybe angulata]|uniref:ribonuclease H n=1 Tax=Ephemerocybe angulata TaxID=980116 RepID=A0A8H6IAM8_9AGAR|nr:hypothetical protein DFP72DRAFT_804645 [Tulosesus angulatus]
MNLALRVPSAIPQTNNTAEALAVLAAIRAVSPDTPLVIKSDSQITINAITKSALNIEDSNWAETQNRKLIEPIIALVRSREAPTVIEKVKAHCGIHGNEEADRLADIGANAPPTDETVDLTIDPMHQVQGMKLRSATQGRIYRELRRISTEKTKPRRQTTMHLDVARHEIEQRTGIRPTDKAIWTSLRKGDITNKKATQLIWRLMHHGFAMGEYWVGKKKVEHRARCRHCDTIETPDHIFTECRFSGQNAVWKTVAKLMDEKNIPWVRPTLGTVLGCGISKIKDEITGKPRPAADRFYTKIVSEALLFIWKIRCEWRMQKGEEIEEAHTDNEILKRWVATLNRIIRFDIISSHYKPKKNKNKKKLKLPTEDLVINTWWDVVDNNADLEWEVRKKSRRRRQGVLVGIRA